jgi:hypothetical protein
MRIAWVCMVLMILPGCTWKGGQGDFRGEGDLGSRVWRAKPVRMRVYPSTRFVQEGDRSILEARLELMDEMGDSVKGAGRFRIELFAGGWVDIPGVGQRLYDWEVETLKLADQRLYYDAITRAYLFRLRLDDNTTALRSALLHVMYASPDGARLEAHAVLPLDLHSIGLSGAGD